MLPLSPQRGSQKHKKGRFTSKIALRLKKVCYKVSLCENCQRWSCKAFISLTNRAKMIGGGRPLLREILDQSDRVGVKSPIFDLFARSDSAVTPSEKNSINTNRKSTTRFPMAQDEHRTLSLSPQRVAQKRKVSEIWTVSCDDSERYEIGCQLLLIINEKSHTGFPLVATSVTLNNLKHRNSPYFVFFPTKFDRFSGWLYHSGWR